jgi:hypothetical protein
MPSGKAALSRSIPYVDGRRAPGRTADDEQWRAAVDHSISWIKHGPLPHSLIQIASRLSRRTQASDAEVKRAVCSCAARAGVRCEDRTQAPLGDRERREVQKLHTEVSPEQAQREGEMRSDGARERHDRTARDRERLWMLTR